MFSLEKQAELERRHEAAEYLMNNYRKEALEAMATIVNPLFCAEVAIGLAYAYENDDEKSEHVFDALRLNQLHKYALLGREKDFIKEYDSIYFKGWDEI